jgi:hypothetical protein
MIHSLSTDKKVSSQPVVENYRLDNRCARSIFISHNEMTFIKLRNRIRAGFLQSSFVAMALTHDITCFCSERR